MANEPQPPSSSIKKTKKINWYNIFFCYCQGIRKKVLFYWLATKLSFLSVPDFTPPSPLLVAGPLKKITFFWVSLSEDNCYRMQKIQPVVYWVFKKGPGRGKN